MKKLVLVLLAALGITALAQPEGNLFTASDLAALLHGELLAELDDYIAIETDMRRNKVEDVLKRNRARYATPVTLKVKTGDRKNMYFILTPDEGVYLRGVSNATSTQKPSTRRERDGCTYTSNSNGSNMSCYSNGRLTYRSVCTINSNYEVRCTSNTY